MKFFDTKKKFDVPITIPRNDKILNEMILITAPNHLIQNGRYRKYNNGVFVIEYTEVLKKKQSGKTLFFKENRTGTCVLSTKA